MVEIAYQSSLNVFRQQVSVNTHAHVTLTMAQRAVFGFSWAKGKPAKDIYKEMQFVGNVQRGVAQT